MLRSSYSAVALLLLASSLGCKGEEVAKNSDHADPGRESVGQAHQAVAATGAATHSAAPKPAVPPKVPTQAPAGASAMPTASLATAGVAAKKVAAASPVAADLADKTIHGPVVKGDGYSIQMRSQGNPKVGVPSSVEVILTAAAPYKCNDKYPYKFKPESGVGVTYPEATLRNMEVGKQQSTMKVPFTATEAGAKTLAGTLSFSVCTEDRCLVEKQTINLTVNVGGA